MGPRPTKILSGDQISVASDVESAAEAAVCRYAFADAGIRISECAGRRRLGGGPLVGRERKRGAPLRRRAVPGATRLERAGAAPRSHAVARAAQAAINLLSKRLTGFEARSEEARQAGGVGRLAAAFSPPREAAPRTRERVARLERALAVGSRLLDEEEVREAAEAALQCAESRGRTPMFAEAGRAESATPPPAPAHS